MEEIRTMELRPEDVDDFSVSKKEIHLVGESKVESHTFIDTFFTFEDAVTWVEAHIRDHPSDEWVMEECRINYLNFAFRTGVVFRKAQRELFGGIDDEQ